VRREPRLEDRPVVSYKYVRVSPTKEEIDAFRKSHSGFRPSVNRFVCRDCGKRLWGSGLGIGSHNRACKGRTR
jgi:hypothetical protein